MLSKLYKDGMQSSDISWLQIYVQEAFNYVIHTNFICDDTIALFLLKERSPSVNVPLVLCHNNSVVCM